ncbi:unnamed protein product [Nezara viridula]|uniref:Uncharacterized protein n=1 Tax=Nezara viridula TaxID=85310 RepID=A0A9P0HMI6_NEZVI|nr:unnamed protein product [Nezara viridula]
MNPTLPFPGSRSTAHHHREVTDQQRWPMGCLQGWSHASSTIQMVRHKLKCRKLLKTILQVPRPGSEKVPSLPRWTENAQLSPTDINGSFHKQGERVEIEKKKL